MRCSRNSSCHMRRYMRSHMARGNRSFGEIISQSCNCRLSSAWPWVLAYLASCCRLDLPIVFYSPTVLLPTLLYSNNLSFFHPGGSAWEVPISYEASNCFPPDQTLFFQLTPLRDFQREQEKEKEFRIKWEVKSSRPAWKSARTLADW